MASYTTTLVAGIVGISPNNSGVVAPTIATAVSFSVPTGIVKPAAILSPSRPREVLGNRNRQFLSSTRVQTIGDQWFEEIYVFPTSVDAGIVISEVTTQIEIYNAYREGDANWTSYDDSAAGAGVSLTPAGPPATITLNSLRGSIHDLVVSPLGPPSVSADLDFIVLDPSGAPAARAIMLTALRSVFFPFEPEVPILEALKWRTKILRSFDSSEQRQSVRLIPQAKIQMRLRTEGADRRKLENLVFDGQSRAFGVPVWYEATELTTAIAATDLTATVDSTANANFVVGGLAAAWSDSQTFEVLEVASTTATTVTFTSAFTGTFPVGSFVFPVLRAFALGKINQRRWIKNLQEDVVEFTVIDNGVDLSDISSYSTYTPTGGVARLLLDDPNLMEGDTISEEFDKVVVVIDNDAGSPGVFSGEDVSREVTTKGLYSDTPAGLTKIRGLLHYLAGRRVSFYLPTFYEDLELQTAIASADTVIDIVDVDYVNLVANRQPRNVVRVVKTDGTKSDPKLVTSSSKPSAGVERLDLDADTVGIDVALADIDRIEYVKKSRLDTDVVTIRHFNSSGKAKVFFPVVTVLEAD